MISTDWFPETGGGEGKEARDWRTEGSLGGSEAPSLPKPQRGVGQEGSVCPHRLERQCTLAHVKASAVKLAPVAVVGQGHVHTLLSPQDNRSVLSC